MPCALAGAGPRAAAHHRRAPSRRRRSTPGTAPCRPPRGPPAEPLTYSTPGGGRNRQLASTDSAREVELRPHRLRDEVDVLLEVVGDVGADEGADRDHLEPVLARVVQDVADEGRAKTVTFVSIIDLRVRERSTPGVVVVVREPGDLPVDQ